MEIQHLKYDEALARDGQFVSMPVGVSMWPMLKNRRDSIVIGEITRPIKSNDVVLYKLKNGKRVLHRVISVREDSYVIRGDNCNRNEYGITSAQIIGILKGFYKGEKYIDCETNRLYKIYVFLCRATHYIRIPFRTGWRLFKILCRKIVKKHEER